MQAILLLALIAQSPDLRPRLIGPAQVPAGDQVIVTATLSAAGDCLSVDRLGDESPPSEPPFANLAWRLLLVGSDKRIRVSLDPWGRPEATLVTAAEGRYEFLLVVSDGKTIACAKHVTVVGTPPNPGPSPGPGPGPSPNPSRFGATEAARQWAAETPASLRPRLATFAAACRTEADAVLKNNAVRTPQEVLNVMRDSANALGPEFANFRAALKAFSQKLIAENKFRTSRDCAEYLAEIASGLSS